MPPAHGNMLCMSGSQLCFWYKRFPRFQPSLFCFLSLMPGYNPLTGEGGGACSWRPGRRGPSSGGWS
jgi:hypothetical protein